MTPGDINKASKSLKLVKKGDRVQSAASSDRINAIQEILKALIRGDNVVTTPPIRKKTHEGHFVIQSDAVKKGFGGSEIETPYQVVTVPNAPGDNTIGQLIGVISNSHLWNSEDKDTYEEDNSNWGLLPDDPQPGDSLAWRNNDFGDKIWLQIELDENQVIQNIDIMHGVVGSGQWDTYPNPIEINDDDPNNVYQQFYHQIIAEITQIDDPRPGFSMVNESGQTVQVTQLLFNDLMMTTAHTTLDADYPNTPLLVPTLWWMLPGTSTDGNADEINNVPPQPDGSEGMTPWQFGDADVDEFPFQVVGVPKAGAGYIGVISDSHLMNSEDRSTYEEDNSNWGLLADDQSTGAFECPAIGNKIWLQIELSDVDQSITNIDVKWGGVGGSDWSTFPDPIEINDDDPNNVYQQYYHQVIAEITDPAQDPRPGFVVTVGGQDRQITQLLYSDLEMTSAITTRDADYAGLPLLVPDQGTMLPATNVDGSADPINDVPDPPGMTPWQYGGRLPIWNFQLNDASDAGGMKIEILDGMFNGVLPYGMGDDGFTVDITEWDPTDGEVDIVLTVAYQLDGTFLDTNISIDAVKPENYPEDEPFHSISIGLGVAYVNPNGNYIDEIRNTQLGDIDRQLVPLQVNAFQMFDASTDSNAAVIIYDGDVIDQNGEGHTPESMGNDDFIADNLQDGFSIFVQITHDDNWDITAVPTIEWEASVPDDTPTVANIEIGYVEVFPPEGQNESVPQVIPHNTVCGDIEFLPPPPDVPGFDFMLEDASEGGSALVRIWDGVVIGPNGDPVDPSGMPTSDNDYQIGAYEGMEIWVGVQWSMETDDGVSGDDIISVWIGSGNATPDDSGLIQYITLGNTSVSFDPTSGDASVFPTNEVCGDVEIPYPPHLDSPEILQLSVDKDTGNVVWKTSKIAQVTAESTDFGGTSDSGPVTLDDIDVLTFDTADFSVWDGGGGQAVITSNSGTGGLSVQGDTGAFVDNVDHIQFTIHSDPSYGAIDVEDGGGGVAIVYIPVIPQSPGGIAVLGDDNGATGWFSTNQCSVG